MIPAVYFTIALLLAAPVYVLLFIDNASVPAFLVRLLRRVNRMDGSTAFAAAPDGVGVKWDENDKDAPLVILHTPRRAPAGLEINSTRLAIGFLDRIAVRIAARILARRQLRVDLAFSRKALSTLITTD